MRQVGRSMWRKLGLTLALVLVIGLVLTATSFYGSVSSYRLDRTSIEMNAAYTILRDQLEQLAVSGEEAHRNFCVGIFLSSPPINSQTDSEILSELRSHVPSSLSVTLVSYAECTISEDRSARFPTGQKADFLSVIRSAQVESGEWMGKIGCCGPGTIYQVHYWWGHPIVVRGGYFAGDSRRASGA